MMDQRVKSISIVTVDSSPAIVERLATLLNEINNIHLIGNAFDSESAIALIEETEPCLVIADISLEDHLNNREGINLLISVREKYPNITIIILSNMIEPAYKDTCLIHGADYFLDKSLEFDLIAEIVDRTLKSRGPC